MNHSNIKKKILIFIPAYNVEKKIYSVIERIPKEIFQHHDIEGQLKVSIDQYIDKTKNSMVHI